LKSYSNEDMTVNLNVDGQLVINWQPLAINRLVRFFKFMKFKQQVKTTELE
jgi:hypothetical protein